MASMTERCFGSPGKCWRASWAKGEGANQPTKGWCAPHTLSHVTWGGGAPPPGLGGKPPPAWLGGQVSLGFSLGRSNLLGRRPLGETLGRLPLSPCPYIYWRGGRAAVTSSLAQPSLLLHLLLLHSAWRSPAGESRAPLPPCRRVAGVLPQLLLSPCWIKKEETSPGCTCVERGGAVRSALDRIFRDLNRREYDSINRVLVTLPLSDLQGYEDALPLSRC